jgi:two-component sensor histidine kinase
MRTDKRRELFPETTAGMEGGGAPPPGDDVAGFGFDLLSSTLDAQFAGVRDPAAMQAVATLRQRLAVFVLCAGVGADRMRIPLAPALRDTVMRLAVEQKALDRSIDVSVVATPVAVPATTAAPLLLIAGELVRNALQYGFRGRRSGMVRTELDLRGDSLVLGVRDDGVGISDGTLSSKGCGLDLIHDLARGLGGKVLIWREVGTSAVVSVPLRGQDGG